MINQPGSIPLAKSELSGELYRRNESFYSLVQFTIKERIYLRRRRKTMLNPRLQPGVQAAIKTGAS
ncbi:MAG: hypothetical protein RBT25_04145 [Lentisphaeria bacterium]|nr:hypothetical protein [Lentisphaeria bacterium]